VEWRRAIWHAVEHLLGTSKEVPRAQDKIEIVPMLLNPFAAGSRVIGIVIELAASADVEIGISLSQTSDFIEVDSSVITIVIGKRYVGQTRLTRRIRPGLEQNRRVSRHPSCLC